MTENDVMATVIVAAWCAEDRLARSVHSALSQDLPSIEVIVVDDASPDGTAQLARQMAEADPRIRVVSLERNGGPAVARNAAIDIARGKWVAVLDSDDEMRPGRLAGLTAAGERLGADCVYDDLQPVDPAGQDLGPSHLASLNIAQPEQWTLERFLSGCGARPGQAALGYLKPVIRRSFIEKTGLRYDPSLRNGEDFHLVAELLALGGALWFVPGAGYLYTQRDGSISRRLDLGHARALTAADSAFCSRHASSLSPDARQLMRARGRNLADMIAVEAAINAIKTRHYGKAAATLATRPSAMVRLAGKVRDKLAIRSTA
ncbi:glycosyltransferase family 2 protein [Allosediminivita pacifica]|uniref:Succinoglycan biosynthesis protein ExoO n=1 Tax=Allosediminivita pacifica TaxID=1267769 RepID=A0A2T6B5I2_9RHOB|nr:glycosyltransferase family 2 protein [Allosediminivita pacifica]PTX51292.1 succinoglycan biosynthesis protein ExoO [Allosediminivita pacifica]GGA98632.1 succinoglycan biosynthesis protein ExoO [Allosediminivita pacifica]